jgi:hypothetical protein
MLLPALLVVLNTAQVTTALDDAERPFEPVAAITISPISTFMLAVAVEGQFRVSDHFTTYVAGEYYALWSGWGVQTGARWFPQKAFKGFFIDAHLRASDLYFVHAIGGGLEIGTEHQLGKSHWTFLWSVGTDVGAGAWTGDSRGPASAGLWFSQGPVIVPKLRLMLGYSF